METIGVHELRERASETLRRVREDGDMFEVTYRGRVIVRLVPVIQPETEDALTKFSAEWEKLSKAISDSLAGWSIRGRCGRAREDDSCSGHGCERLGDRPGF